MGIFSCTEKQNSVTLHSEIRKTGAIHLTTPHYSRPLPRGSKRTRKHSDKKEKSAKTTYKYFSGNSPATLYRQGHRITN